MENYTYFQSNEVYCTVDDSSLSETIRGSEQWQQIDCPTEKDQRGLSLFVSFSMIANFHDWVYLIFDHQYYRPYLTDVTSLFDMLLCDRHMHSTDKI